MTCNAYVWVLSCALIDCSAVVEKPHKTHSTVNSEKATDIIMKSFGISGMAAIMPQCSGMSKGHVAVVANPSNKRKVVAASDFAPGKLQLLCVTMSIVKLKIVAESPKEVSPGELEVADPAHGTQRFKVLGEPPPAADNDGRYCCPFFLVSQSEVANMVIGHKEITLNKTKVKVPMYTNSVAIVKGDLLKADKPKNLM
jgi:hypothetical protein